MKKSYDKLFEHCEIFSGYAFKSQDLQSEGDIPVVKIGNISNGKDVILDNDIQFVSKDFLKINDKYHINRGDVLISLTGSHINQPNSMVGRCCRYYQKETLLLNQRAGKVIAKKDNDLGYLYYMLNSQSMKINITNRAYGAANQANVSPTDILNIKFFFPPLPTQQKIAGILSKYDEAIENNNRRIKLLEQMAQNLYKEWFVRFRFPGWQMAEFENGVPKGWKVVQVQDLFDITIGRTPDRKVFDYFSNNKSDYLWVSIADMKDKMFVLSSSEYLTDDAIQKVNMPMVKENTVILSFKLSVGRVAITTQLTCTNEAIAHFNTNNRQLLEYTYLYLKTFQYQDLGNTSAIGNAVNSTIIKKMKFLYPDEKVLSDFHFKSKCIFDEIKLLTYKTKSLSRQRDLLLPRLMSGKLQVLADK